ncbi:ATP-dependent RNA helicase ddx46-like [Culex pipiens pallens]|uniref:ATP-dependent RNA helicase ddx46-like n=1 Tax=Culex pipiens pallens TaxID=42434 RepID=UPI0019545982|nr:ATP-dependent RNA helicase ddx46-like [Culex pipiens pallens]
MEREYDQQVQQHDGQYRDGRNDGSRYSSDRMANNNNKNKLLNQRSSKEKDRRGSDCKVTTSLQFKNQTRNKTNQRRWFADGWSGRCCRRSGRAQQQCRSAVRKCPEQQDEQRNCFTSRWSSGANVGPATGSAAFEPAQMIPQQPPPHLPQQQAPIQQAQPQPQQIQQQQLHQQQSPYNDHHDSYGDSKKPCSRTIRLRTPPSSRSRLENGHS